MRFADGLTMADNTIVPDRGQGGRERARLLRHVMPKPLFGENGSGMHTHQSLFQGERNAFFDADDE